MKGRVVGVLGATGMVGQGAAVELRRLGADRLRLGARRPDALRRLVDERLDGRGEVRPADATDPQSLAAFCSGCDIVINCAGPTYLLKETVAAAAVAAGAHCVDVAGDDPAHERMVARGLAGTDRTVVFSAGVLPGLSSVLPRWLARAFDRPETLTAHVGGREPCSPLVAEDMLLSLRTGGADGAAFGEALAAWRAGRRRSRALRATERTRAPGFPGPVAATPFLSAETERLAQVLALTDVDWFNVHPGSAVRAEMLRLPHYLAEASGSAGAADRAGGGGAGESLGVRLARAADLDLAGRSPFYAMAFAMTGQVAGGPTGRTVVLRTASSYHLTGLVGALAAERVLAGDVRSGLHFAADVLDPDLVVDGLRAASASFSLSLTVSDTAQARRDERSPAKASPDLPAEDLVEEGVL
ncbi:saccharopine dehydrogenase NADP-binding domain-containing protein [Frankia sp. KB5]|uniref:saccharopine dehydrogenase NADP-binding domain-containing protein n=1 Tax=Frankia sp. KB5 TaxID=683318 RepID=UPI000A0F8F90|nr:saccharopine dehydrogenase NADP-binding domain-containing protein [Frankia sp. KB5]ORT53488.1 hypothetical protein KBI5_06635 [Frankia sp. KB5]